ncbi:MAG TPA: DUF2231 domain-containing protein [Sphingobacteriaceae bacterium]
MKSKASLKGHPIHPMLVGFPIAFFIGTLLFDGLGLLYNSESYWQTGKYLEIAGIISAVMAAIPGIIDYTFTVPSKSSAKKRAVKHGILNVSMLILFIIAFTMRTEEVSSVIIGLELVGIILLTIAGWLGGTLVYRNQIGVDQRYADAGKWKEAYFKQSEGLIEVATSDELKVNQMKLLHFQGNRVVLARSEKGYTAFSDRCTHRGGSLAGGAMICGTVQCPWHGSQFDTETGEVKAGPANDKIKVYTVSENSGKIFIHL